MSGPLPNCAADQILRLCPATQAEPPPLISSIRDAGRAGRISDKAAASAQGAAPTTTGGNFSSVQIDEDEALRQALALSLEQYQQQDETGGTGIGATAGTVVS